MEAMSLIKFFSKEEHFLWLKDWYTMFRTPHYYRECEDIGRGDKNESVIGFWDQRRGDDIPQLMINGKPIDISSIQSLMIYPPHEQSDSWMQSWCVVGRFNKFELSLARMLEEFGIYFALLPSKNIKRYATALQETSGLDVNFGFMRYSDNPLERSLSVKDQSFEYQKEFRFYVGSCDKNEKQDMELRVKNMSSLLTEAGSLKFTSENGEVRYCSTGSKEVVLSEE